MSLEVGQVFAGYTILRVLGEGGMGVVYLASHPRLPREDALKVLPQDSERDAEYRARFLREADLAAQLSHPHIVGIHDRGEHDGRFWISMDYVAGTDAARLLKASYPGGMPLEVVIPMVTAVGSALDYAHHQGLLHRDVKPANILLAEPDGQAQRVYLADFGVARRIDDSAGLTADNTTVGTVAYVSPEQLRGEPVDGRADQYALACTVFHLLAGRPPYVHTNPAIVISKHVNDPPPSIAACRPDLAWLEPVLAKAMAKDPVDRFRSCAEFVDRLARQPVLTPSYPHIPTAWHSHETQPAIATISSRPATRWRRFRHPGVVIGALLIAALLVVGGVFAAVHFGRQHKPTTTSLAPVTKPATAPPGSGASSQGPFTGTYRADFGPVTDFDDVQVAGAHPSTATYGLRSACGGAGCLATASRLNGETYFASSMVFDEIAERWVAVALSNNKCRGAAGEVWEVFTLQQRPDGTLTGVHTRTAQNNCAEKRTVTLTRTGDVDLASLPDPATLPPRIVSPAATLHGHYQLVRTFAGGDPQQLGISAIATNCLHTGERCMSYFHAKSGDVPLIFAGASWTWAEQSDGKCPDGKPAHLNANGQYPLPQPHPDPLPLLSGHGHWQQTGGCAVSMDFDETFTRTGD
jgi:serine/threonine-protein kinase